MRAAVAPAGLRADAAATRALVNVLAAVVDTLCLRQADAGT
jgi:hypothetical protein